MDYKKVNEKIAPITEEVLLEARVSSGLDQLSEALSEAGIAMDSADFDGLVEGVHGLLQDSTVPAETRKKVFAAWAAIHGGEEVVVEATKE